MIQVIIDALEMTAIIPEYTIDRKPEEMGVTTSTDARARFEGQDFRDLFEFTKKGYTQEPVTVKIFCGNDFVELPGIIRHNEGKYLHKSCIVDKKVELSNPFECVLQGEINIYDYAGSELKNAEGNPERITYYKELTYFLGDDENYGYTFNEILTLLGGVPDKTNEGYVVEYVSMNAFTQWEVGHDPEGTYDLYTGHLVYISVSYVRWTSPTQITDQWIEVEPGVWVLNPTVFPPYTWNAPQYAQIGLRDTGGYLYYTDSIYTAGRYKSFEGESISNARSFNEIIQGIYECSGIEVISNFFNINPDATNPDNPEYTYAERYLQDLKIVQSFDVIRASANEDSFGLSGKLDVKKFLKDITTMFDIQTIYDATADKIRIEHYSYFYSKGIDTQANNIPYEMADEIEVNKDLVHKELFKFAAKTGTAGFYETIIDYRNYKATDKLNEVPQATELILTDIQDCLNNKIYEQSEYEKYFFLASTRDNAIIENNNGLSFKSLVGNLKTGNRQMQTAYQDGTPIEFKGFSIGLSTEVKIYAGIQTFLKLYPNNVIKLANGTWRIEDFEFKSGGVITLKIKK